MSDKRSCRGDMSQSLFLTGATGALGPILAAELLTSHAAARLRVLIRSGDSPEIARFDQWIPTLESVLAATGQLLPNPRKHVGLITGDLCSPGLGLSESQHGQFIDE